VLRYLDARHRMTAAAQACFIVFNGW